MNARVPRRRTRKQAASANRNRHRHSNPPSREQLRRENERLLRENEDLRRKVAERERQIADAERQVADAEEQIADLLTGEQLHAAFEELSEKQRATLEMYFFEGLDLREIGRRLAETLENTRHFYYRGLDRLRKSAAAMAHRNGKCL